MKNVRYRNRSPNPHRRTIEEELKYLENNPEECTRVQYPGEPKFEDWYRMMRGSLLRIARGINIPLTIRQEEGQTGLVLWKATEEELQRRPNPPRRPTVEQKAMGVTEDLAEGADEDEVEEAQESLAFTCPACEKAFDSERGINAHKRMAKH